MNSRKLYSQTRSLHYGASGCGFVIWKRLIAMEGQILIDRSQIVINTDLSTWSETRDGDHLCEYTTHASVNDAPRNVHQVAYLQIMGL